MVSSKQLTTFSDHRLPLDAPDHISLPGYVEYLHTYIERFNLSPHIKLSTAVTSVSPLLPGDNKWKHRVRYASKDPTTGQLGEESIYDCSHIAVCTGLHVSPAIPTIPGIEHAKGPVFHSSQYKSRSQLTGQDVLILGAGETAMDLAYESIKADAHSVTMCFRTGFLSFPKVLNRFQVLGYPFQGRLPIDGLITNLFETAYVHHSIRRSRLRSLISDRVIKKVMWFLTGTQSGCNQHVGALPDEILGRSYVFLNKSHRAMPYLNRPYKQPQPFLDFIGNKYIDPPEDATSPRHVDTCTWPSHLTPDGVVHFIPNPSRKDFVRQQKLNRPLTPTTIIQCTGYKQSFPFFPASYPTSDTTNIRNIISTADPTIAFIGFVRPGVGAIPPIAEQQSMWYTSLILNKMPLPTKPGHYKLLPTSPTPRIDYGVDYSTYMSILASDFGGAPSLSSLLTAHGWRLTLIYCFGASFVSFYRLVGPYASAECVDVANTELLDTIMRRGLIGNFFFGVVPMLFYGLVSAVAWVLEVVGVVGREEEGDVVDG